MQAATAQARVPYTLSLARLQTVLLWLFMAASGIALIEPSPYDVLFVPTLCVFFLVGMRASPSFAPLFILLLTFNLGGAIALIPYLDDRASVTFVVISFYLGVTSVFFACLMLEDTERRLQLVQNGWICAGVIAAACGIAGYMNLGGTGAIFTRHWRASGTFKDPNVFGPFLVVPAVIIIQGFLAGTLRRPFLNGAALFVILGGLLLSFSRGAWGVMLLSTVLTGALLILTSRSAATRARVILLAVVGAALLACLLGAVLAIDSVRELFELRFALLQDYDSGPRGRFGKLTEALTMLLELPNGFGPLKFDNFFPEAPHNVFVNAFASYGWLGGFSYLCLTVLTLRVGWSAVWLRTPWQGATIALWSATFAQILQGMQIDSDHWRHFWALLGLTWGLAAASRAYLAESAPVQPSGQGGGRP